MTLEASQDCGAAVRGVGIAWFPTMPAKNGIIVDWQVIRRVAGMSDFGQAAAQRGARRQ